MRGGKREGAGRKPGPDYGKPVAGPGRQPQAWRLKLGDVLVMHEETPGGSTLQQKVEIVAIDRTHLVMQVGEVLYKFVR